MNPIIKTATSISAILAVVVSLTAIYNWVEGKGYSRAVTEISRESADKIAEATAQAVKDAEVEIEKAQKRSRILFDAELANVREAQTVEIQIREVIKNVEKIKYVDNCGKLNDGSIMQLNEAINIANRTSQN